jgi:GNAT superfamily N-acetyltransferase
MSIECTSYSDDHRNEILDLWTRALPLDAINEGMFESRVLLDDNFDSETFILACENNTLAGFLLGTHAKRTPLGDADPEGTRSWITALAVDPSRDLNAVGSALLAEAEKRFVTLGKIECLVSTYPPGYFTPGIDQINDAPLLKLFLSHGYTKQREAISMDASIVLFRVSDSVIQKQEDLRKEGIEIRPYRRSDLLRFLSFLETTMPTDWVRVERRNLKKISEGGFTENQITVVTHDNKIIGYCQFEGSHFGPFGVSNKYQGRGIGTVLLARTIERMKREGHHDAWVMWTDDVAAKVYGKFGFTETRRFSILKKELI